MVHTSTNGTPYVSERSDIPFKLQLRYQRRREYVDGMVRCQMTGEKIMPPYSNPNVCGRSVVTTQVLLNKLDYVWVRDLQTYMPRLGTEIPLVNAAMSGALNDPFSSSARWYQLGAVEDGEVAKVFMTDDTNRYLVKEYGYYIENTEQFFEKRDAAGDIVYVDDRGWYTLQYASDNFYCHDCGDWYDYPQEDYDSSDDWQDEIQGYDHDPLDDYGCESQRHGQKSQPVPGELYFGVEVESEMRDTDYASTLVTIAHRLKCGACSDGSLRNGVEFKTRPLTYNLVIDNLRKLHTDISKYVTFGQRCGLHVHISRSALTPIQVGLISLFLYDKSKEMTKFLDAFSGREPNEFCARSDDYHGRRDSRTLKSHFKGRYGTPYRYENKYQALNLSYDHTIEFRLFAGTAKTDQLLARVQFVKALVDYCSITERHSGIKGFPDLNAFFTFVLKYGRRQWPELVAELRELGYIAPRKTRPEPQLELITATTTVETEEEGDTAQCA